MLVVDELGLSAKVNVATPFASVTEVTGTADVACAELRKLPVSTIFTAALGITRAHLSLNVTAYVADPPIFTDNAVEGDTVSDPSDETTAAVVTPETSAVPLAVVALKPWLVDDGVKVTVNVPSIVVAVVAFAAPTYARS
jgi:hypothetical protein